MRPYSPREDSELLKKHIKAFAKGSVLDMGTGSGIIAKEAAKYADAVLAVDVDDDVINWCRKNIKEPKITLQESDLFNKVTGRFDLITFNAPYLPQDKNDIKDRRIYGGKYGYETIVRFLRDAVSYLNTGGVILLVFSSFSKPRKIKTALKELRYKYELIDKIHISFEDIFLYAVRRE